MNTTTVANTKVNWLGVVGWLVFFIGIVPVFGGSAIKSDAFLAIHALLWIPGLVLIVAAMAKTNPWLKK